MFKDFIDVAAIFRKWYKQTMAKVSLKTKDVDSIIGRQTFSYKEEVDNLTSFYTFSKFETLITKTLEQDKTPFLKNDIVRTWNLLLKEPNKHTSFKKITFEELNLVKTESLLPLNDHKIETAYHTIFIIINTFISQKYYNLKEYDNGFLLWIDPSIEKILVKAISPIYYDSVSYYGIKDQRGGNPIYSSSTTSYRYRYHETDKERKDREKYAKRRERFESDYFDQLGRSYSYSKKEDDKDKGKNLVSPVITVATSNATTPAEGVHHVFRIKMPDEPGKFIDKAIYASKLIYPTLSARDIFCIETDLQALVNNTVSQGLIPGEGAIYTSLNRLCAEYHADNSAFYMG